MGKAATPHKTINYPKEAKIKFVKKAGLWCKTWFEKDRTGKYLQKQEWFSEKPKEAKDE